MPIRVVSDSSSDLYSVPEIYYTTVPLKVRIGSTEYVDTAEADPIGMMATFQTSSEKSSTSCPNIQEWLDAFEGYDEIFCVTISSALSASYECCQQAKEMYRQSHPGAKIHIIDSKATGPYERLIIERLRDNIMAGLSYQEIRADIIEYQKHARILFPLSSLQNLARNGRVNATVARIAGALNIWIIGDASEAGEVNLLHKCRGENKALKITFKEMLEHGYAGGKVRIDHCLNAVSAEKLRQLIEAEYPDADIDIIPCGILCSYYADEGGLIVGYEVE